MGAEWLAWCQQRKESSPGRLRRWLRLSHHLCSVLPDSYSNCLSLSAEDNEILGSAEERLLPRNPSSELIIPYLAKYDLPRPFVTYCARQFHRADVHCHQSIMVDSRFLRLALGFRAVIGRVWRLPTSQLAEAFGPALFRAFAVNLLEPKVTLGIETRHCCSVCSDLPLTTVAEHPIFTSRPSTIQWSYENFSLIFDSIQSLYRFVPYHNYAHAALVTHHVVLLLKMLDVWDFLSVSRQFAVVVAALGHDSGHFGRDNTFLVSSNHPLVSRLGGTSQSYLESYHAHCLLSLLKTNRSALPQEIDIDSLAEPIRMYILATDPSSTTYSLSVMPQFHTDSSGALINTFDPLNCEEDFDALVVLVLKAADIGYTTLEWSRVLEWINRAYMEFWSEGDALEERGLPVPNLMARGGSASAFWQQNSSFFQFAAVQLFETLCNVECHLKGVPLEQSLVKAFCVDHLRHNTQLLTEAPCRKDLVFG